MKRSKEPAVLAFARLGRSLTQLNVALADGFSQTMGRFLPSMAAAYQEQARSADDRQRDHVAKVEEEWGVSSDNETGASS